MGNQGERGGGGCDDVLLVHPVRYRRNQIITIYLSLYFTFYFLHIIDCSFMQPMYYLSTLVIGAKKRVDVEVGGCTIS